RRQHCRDTSPRLQRPLPSGWTPVYPCRRLRQRLLGRCVGRCQLGQGTDVRARPRHGQGVSRQGRPRCSLSCCRSSRSLCLFGPQLGG
ncbi:hypothetical protein BN1708_020535, partial [Verticillium longisporum]